jgi:hypothetical protein
VACIYTLHHEWVDPYLTDVQKQRVMHCQQSFRFAAFSLRIIIGPPIKLNHILIHLDSRQQ